MQFIARKLIDQRTVNSVIYVYPIVEYIIANRYPWYRLFVFGISPAPFH